jgi:hypothetical protein
MIEAGIFGIKPDSPYLYDVNRVFWKDADIIKANVPFFNKKIGNKRL